MGYLSVKGATFADFEAAKADIVVRTQHDPEMRSFLLSLYEEIKTANPPASQVQTAEQRFRAQIAAMANSDWSKDEVQEAFGDLLENILATESHDLPYDRQQALIQRLTKVKKAVQTGGHPAAGHSPDDDTCALPSQYCENKGKIKLALVNPETGRRRCVCYSIKFLTEHVANAGWTDPKSGAPFSADQIVRIKRSIDAGNGCFAIRNPTLLHDDDDDEYVRLFRGVNKRVDVVDTVQPGSALICHAMLEIVQRLTRARDSPPTIRISGDNAAVFCLAYTNEDFRDDEGVVGLNGNDERTLVAQGDEEFLVDIVVLPMATQIALVVHSGDRVGQEVDASLLAVEPDTILRKGQVYTIDDEEVEITKVRPFCAVRFPGVHNAPLQNWHDDGDLHDVHEADARVVWYNHGDSDSDL